MDYDKMTRDLAKAYKDFTEPIDLEKLVDEGILIRKGRSYFVQDIKQLPDSAKAKVKTLTQTKDGLRVTFHKVTEQHKKAVKKINKYLNS